MQKREKCVTRTDSILSSNVGNLSNVNLITESCRSRVTASLADY